MKHLMATLTMGAALASTALAGVDAMQNLQKPQSGKAAQFSFGGEKNRDFLLDGNPFQIRAGEMHPQRIPRAYWRHRIQAAKAMGLNTIAFYVFWNDIEKEDGSYDLTGMRDIGAFIDMCAEEGMWVLFRPGPYVCGEWDLGGLPARLMKEKGAHLRTMKNAHFMEEQTRYLEKMAEIVIPRLCKNGGPVLMVQLENEYGSYNSPHSHVEYIQWLKKFWEDKGAGPFYLSEGATRRHLRFAVPGVALGLDPAEREKDFQVAWSVNPEVPVFSSETYPGWLRHWGEGNWKPSREVLDVVRWYMKEGKSFNLFVLHGGTNFGLTAGANCNSNEQEDDIEPDLTSYDYGSPIGEQGNLTTEYYEYRDIIKSALPAEAQVPEPPTTPAAMQIAAFTPEKAEAFGRYFAQPQSTYDEPPTLEALGQNQGMAIYCATLPAGPEATLNCRVHDMAQVYVDGKFVGSINRMKGQTGIRIPARSAEQSIRIVVDTFGHINFHHKMEKDNKGIVDAVTLDGTPVTGWKVSLLPLKTVPQPCSPRRACVNIEQSQSGCFRAEVQLEKVADTFLDMSAWSKGYVWVNGHLLGRYWSIGPQQRLYCPAEWLKEGKNEVFVLDTHRTEPAPIRGCTERNTEVLIDTENANNVW
ncbi:MAG: beta-galactosidase [Akkermansia sp.]|nr:beta-galactosidase [Akkermansia sp.]